MNTIDILYEDLAYNKKYVKKNILAIKKACDNYLKGSNHYAHIDYINEKFKLAEQYQERVFEIEKDIFDYQQ